MDFRNFEIAKKNKKIKKLSQYVGTLSFIFFLNFKRDFTIV